MTQTHCWFSDLPDLVIEGMHRKLSAICSLSAETSLDDRVKKISEEQEPLALLDFAITVSVEAIEELLNLCILGRLVAVGGKAIASELHNF